MYIVHPFINKYSAARRKHHVLRTEVGRANEAKYALELKINKLVLFQINIWIVTSISTKLRWLLLARKVNEHDMGLFCRPKIKEKIHSLSFANNEFFTSTILSYIKLLSKYQIKIK